MTERRDETTLPPSRTTFISYAAAEEDRNTTPPLSSSGSTMSLPPRDVKFGTIVVWEFPPTIGDNPSVSTGVPVALGPKPCCMYVDEIDTFEASRNPLRRTTRDLKVPSRIREELLLNHGFDIEDILVAISEVDKLKSRSCSAKKPTRSFAKSVCEKFPIHRRLSKFMPSGSSSDSLQRSSLSECRVDELMDSEDRWSANGPSNRRARRGSMNATQTDSSALLPPSRGRDFRRYSSDTMLKIPKMDSSLQQRRWDEGSSSVASGTSDVHVSVVLSPQPAQRQGSIRSLSDEKTHGYEENAGRGFRLEDDISHYYQYGDGSPKSRNESTNSATTVNASRRWSLKGIEKRGDVTPRSGARRQSIDEQEFESPPPRRRSSFFGLSGSRSDNRDMRPSPTQRRSSITNDDVLTLPSPSCSSNSVASGTNSFNSRTPARRLSFLASLTDRTWAAVVQYDKDDTESQSIASTASPSSSKTRSTVGSPSSASTLLGPAPFLFDDDDSTKKCLPSDRRRSFLGGWTDSFESKTNANLPRRRKSFLGSSSGSHASSNNSPSNYSDSSTSTTVSNGSKTMISLFAGGPARRSVEFVS